MYDYQVLQVLRSIDASLAALRGDIAGILSLLEENVPALLCCVCFAVVLYAVSWFVRKGSRL